jgi:hypothetical protein
MELTYTDTGFSVDIGRPLTDGEKTRVGDRVARWADYMEQAAAQPQHARHITVTDRDRAKAYQQALDDGTSMTATQRNAGMASLNLVQQCQDCGRGLVAGNTAGQPYHLVCGSLRDLKDGVTPCHEGCCVQCGMTNG